MEEEERKGRRNREGRRDVTRPVARILGYMDVCVCKLMLALAGGVWGHDFLRLLLRPFEIEAKPQQLYMCHRVNDRRYYS